MILLRFTPRILLLWMIFGQSLVWSEVFFSSDFESDAVGTEPSGFDDNSFTPVDGTDIRVIDGASDPVSPLSGRSAYILDSTTMDNLRFGSDFNGGVNVSAVHVSFNFSRGPAQAEGERITFSMTHAGLNATSGSRRPFELRLNEDGSIDMRSGPNAGLLTETNDIGTFDPVASNSIEILINSDDSTALNYDVDVGSGTIPANSFHIYINGTNAGQFAMVLDPSDGGVDFAAGLPDLGSFAFFQDSNSLGSLIIDDLIFESLASSGGNSEDPEINIYSSLDFETDIEGEKPVVDGASYTPGSNNATNGAVIVDSDSTPVANPLTGQSLYFYDLGTSSGNSTHFRFPFNGGVDVSELRVDFDFQRAYAVDPGEGDTAMHVGVGRASAGNLNNSDFRPFRLSIFNDGSMSLDDVNGTTALGDYSTSNANHVTMLINSHDSQNVDYDLPILGTGTLIPNSVHLFLNEVKKGEFDFFVTPDPIDSPQIIFNQENNDLGQIAFFQDTNSEGGIAFDNIVIQRVNTIGSAPDAPTVLMIDTVESRSATISWTDNSSDETGFLVERRVGLEGAWATIADVDADVISFEETDLTPETTYYYRVSATNGLVSAPTNEVEVNTLEQLEPFISETEAEDFALLNSSVEISIDVQGREPLSFQWYEGSTGDTSNPVSGATSATFISPALTENTSFWVQITNSEGTLDSETFAVEVHEPVAFDVTTENELEAAIVTALPGDEIIIADGEYADWVIEIDAEGIEAAQITLRAESPGGVIFTGESRMEIGGEWLVIDGFVYFGEYTGNDDEVIQFRSNGHATDCRLTNVSIIDYIPAEREKMSYVSMYGQRNRVDHCYFTGHNVPGVTLVVWPDGEPNHHRIDHNHFANRIDGNENGWETIRIGTSDVSMSSSMTTVEYNLFTRVDGEIEIISNKTHDNIYRYNTFKESRGTLTLRHGDRCIVEGNYFLGGFLSETGGVRVIGRDHVVINNYFEGTTARDDAAITVYAGVSNSPLNEYFSADRATIAFNTFYDNSGPAIEIASGFGERDRTVLPTGIVVANNILHAGSKTTGSFVSGTNPGAQTWEENIIFGRPMGGNLAEGFTSVDPELMLDSETGIQRILAGSPAVDASSDVVDDVLLDIDGQTRDENPDVGADEVSDGAMASNGPLKETDVGPSYSPGQRPINISLNIPIGEDGWPNLLSETGAFKSLVTLEPEDGIWSYEPTISFWSDYAKKSRWFYIPVGENIGFSDVNNWSFPAGSVWVKHFDIELERGNPDTAIRLETRFLVKTEFSSYGVAYRWNEAGTEATLVGEDGVSFDLSITENGEQKTQTWSIPSRADCLVCHTINSGIALSFNTYQLNRKIRVGNQDVNYLEYLSKHQFFEEEIEDAHAMPRFAELDDPEASLDFKARSYLAANCVNCHQPGGTEMDPFDVRPKRTLGLTGLIDGDSSTPDKSIVTRGDPDNSTLLLRMLSEDPLTRMPPIGSSEIDPVGTALIRSWIESLATYQSYAEWQEAQFGELKDTVGGKDDDPDKDGDTNEVEFLNRTNPQSGPDFGGVHIAHGNGMLNMQIPAGPYANYRIETSEDLDVWRALPGEEGQVKTLPEGKDTVDVSLPVDPRGTGGQFFRVQREER